jgi:hypothetical protein
VADQDLSNEVQRLESLSDDELLSFLGAASLTDGEKIAAAVSVYAPADIAERLESEGLFGRDQIIDLVDRGKALFERVVDARREELRRLLCPAYGNVPEKELVFGAAPILADELTKVILHAGEPISASLATAILLVRYGIDRLCEGFADEGAA